MPVRNALEGMQGKTAGVDITSSQRPGEVGNINIRGQRSISGTGSTVCGRRYGNSKWRH